MANQGQNKKDSAGKKIARTADKVDRAVDRVLRITDYLGRK